MSLLDNFPHRCTLIRNTRQQDALGASCDVPEVMAAEVECWVQQAGTSEMRDFEKRGMRVNRKVFFTFDPQVTEQYDILITEINGVAQTNPARHTVRTQPQHDASAGLGVVWRVMTEELTSKN